MAETRAERLARIRGYVEWRRGKWHVNDRDIAWLLAQIGDDVEYRVEERKLGADGSEWRLSPYMPEPEPTYEHARGFVADALSSEGDDPTHEYRVVSAPVQVWTPVEEEAS